jgi:hypothetical protein
MCDPMTPLPNGWRFSCGAEVRLSTILMIRRLKAPLGMAP